LAPPGAIMQKMQFMLFFFIISFQIDSGGSLIYAHMDNFAIKIRAKKTGYLP
jgi:hypothetical protein